MPAIGVGLEGIDVPLLGIEVTSMSTPLTRTQTHDDLFTAWVNQTPFHGRARGRPPRRPQGRLRFAFYRQRKEEVLLDVNDVALGYQTRMRWNPADQWVWSDTVAHQPLVSVADFEAAQRIRVQHGGGCKTKERAHVVRTYVLRGRLYCGICGRKMQGQYSNGGPYYRCRYPSEYALANHVQHPRNVYLREHDIMPHLDHWLLRAFSPHRLTDTVDRLRAAQQDTPEVAAPDADLEVVITACDTKLAQYRAIADAAVTPPPSRAGPLTSWRNAPLR
jgi:site-specific DNA recombinase